MCLCVGVSDGLCVGACVGAGIGVGPDLQVCVGTGVAVAYVGGSV